MINWKGFGCSRGLINVFLHYMFGEAEQSHQARQPGMYGTTTTRVTALSAYSSLGQVMLT